MLSNLSKVSSKGQIVLPKEFRDKMGIKAGSYVSIILTKEGILIVPENKERSEKKSWRDWAGAFKDIGGDTIAFLKEEHERERKRDERKVHSR
jgi:AbrB family looped-hinge helix DNA binding protein